MLRNRPLYAVIPVRGGSKGIPGKNLYRFGRDSLLERTIKMAKQCLSIDRTIVSTDNQEMFDIARSLGANSPTLRPRELAGDHAKTVDVVLHLIEELEIRDAYILLLQVTSPLRTLSDLKAICADFENPAREADAIVSVTRFDSPHPDKIQKIEDGYLTSYLGKDSGVARQLLPAVYTLNGAFYLTHVDILQHQKTFIPPKTIAFEMPPERSINLDTMMDVYILESLLQKGIVSIEEY